MAQPLDETRPVGQTGEAVVQSVVAQLTLDSLRFDSTALQLDLGDGRGGDLGEVLHLVAGPFARRRVERDDEREGFARGAGNGRAEKAGDA